MKTKDKMPYEQVSETISNVKSCIDLLDGTDSEYFDLKDLIQLVEKSSKLIKSCKGHIDLLLPEVIEEK